MVERHAVNCGKATGVVPISWPQPRVHWHHHCQRKNYLGLQLYLRGSADGGRQRLDDGENAGRAQIVQFDGCNSLDTMSLRQVVLPHKVLLGIDTTGVQLFDSATREAIDGEGEPNKPNAVLSGF